jgi:CRP-like cAMP-binding protein
MPPPLPADDDEPTLPPPPPAPHATPRTAPIEDEKTEPRDLPTRIRPPSIAPQTTATGPLAGAFFAPLPPRIRGTVLQRFRRRMLAAGSVVIRRGEIDHGLVIVVRGRLDLQTAHGDGSQVALGSIGPGDFIGEASLLGHAPSPMHVVVGADAEILVLAPDDFDDVANAFPALRAELEATAAGRARDHEQRLRG